MSTNSFPFPSTPFSCGWPLDSGEFTASASTCNWCAKDSRSNQVTCTAGPITLPRQMSLPRARRFTRPRSNSATERRSPSLRANDTTTRGAATETARGYECTGAGCIATSGKREFGARATVQARRISKNSGEKTCRGQKNSWCGRVEDCWTSNRQCGMTGLGT